MELLTREDILSNAEYEKIREDFRRKILVQKRDRRAQVGEHMTLHFENRDIMRYQVQEMMRVEGMTTDEQMQGELDAYNPVVPQKNELSVTMMIEYETPEERTKYLPQFVGIDEHTFLQIGNTERIPGIFDQGQITEEKVSSVQYVKFRLSDKQTELLRAEGTVVRVLITHPAYSATTILGENIRKAIQSDPS